MNFKHEGPYDDYFGVFCVNMEPSFINGGCCINFVINCNVQKYFFVLSGFLQPLGR
jgi:hypothetical protein